MTSKARRRDREYRERLNDRMDDQREAPALKLVKQPSAPEIQPKRGYKVPKKDWNYEPPKLKPRFCPFKHRDDIVCPACQGYPKDD